MDTSSAYSGSASDRQIVEISNLTKVVDQSEPIPAHCVIKVLKLYIDGLGHKSSNSELKKKKNSTKLHVIRYYTMSKFR